MSQRNELLARIRDVRDAAATSTNGRKGGRGDEAAVEDPPPFDIPPNWAWTTIAEVGFVSPRNADVDDDAVVSFIPMRLIPSAYGVAPDFETRNWGEVKRQYTHIASGDVALAKITPCFENGKSATFVDLEGGLGAATTELHVMRPILVDPEYILAFLKSPHFVSQGIPRMTGTAGQKRVPAAYFSSTPLPLAPLVEQRRIVASLREWMHLCDEFERTLSASESHHVALSRSWARRLHRSESEHDIRTSVEFALANLRSLTSSTQQMEPLRQTVLELAVRGRLAPPDHGDEPVRTALARADNERKALAESGEKRVSRERLALLNEERAPDLPAHWELRALGDLALFIDYRGKTPPKVASGVPLITAKNIRQGSISPEPREFVSEETYGQWMSRGLPRPGDVLFTTEAPMGNAAVVESKEPFALAQRSICFRLLGGLDPQFLALQIAAPPFQDLLSFTATGLTAKGVKAAKLKRLPVAVPPVGEQRRIVAMSNELLAVLAELERALVADHEARLAAVRGFVRHYLSAA